MTKVTFVAIKDEETGYRDGEAGWQILVDGAEVIDTISGDDIDLADEHLAPLWKALGLELKFDWDNSTNPAEYVANVATTILLK